MTTPVRPANLTDLMRSRPAQVPVTTTLLAANVLVFVLMLFAGAGWWHTTNGVQLAWGANFGPATQDGQWWRLFTAMFVHFGIVHLSMNMFALWDVGEPTETVQKEVDRLKSETPRFFLTATEPAFISPVINRGF